MKLRSNKQNKLQGSVLIVGLIVALVFGATLTAYLVMVMNNQKATARAEAWHRALPIAEAGVEEALAHLNQNYSNNMGAAGWNLSDGCRTNGRNLTDGYYTVKIADSNNNPVIYSKGVARVPVDGVYLERTVRVQTVATSIVQNAVSTRYEIKANGHRINTDSFDSSDPTKSGLNGKYDAAKTGDKGDVATNLGTPGALNLGNMSVKGSVHTGPDGTASPGPNCSVGSAEWVNSGNSGIQEGYFHDDMNLPFPEVSVPFSVSNEKVYKKDGTNFFSTGNFIVDEFKDKVVVTGDAVILVNKSCKFSGQDFIQINPGASLTLYVACADAEITGQGVLNQGTSTNFTYIGLASNTSLKIGGNGQLSGFVYAPNAAITLTGGGAVYGAVMGKTLTLGGNTDFHFDEALSKNLRVWYFKIFSWDEI